MAERYHHSKHEIDKVEQPVEHQNDTIDEKCQREVSNGFRSHFDVDECRKFFRRHSGEQAGALSE